MLGNSNCRRRHEGEQHIIVSDAIFDVVFAGVSIEKRVRPKRVYDILEHGPPKDTEQIPDDRLQLVGCWAHCRRYFFEAAVCRYEVGIRGLTLIRAMYGVERGFGKVVPSKRKQLRDAHLRPLIDLFFQWVRQAKNQTLGRNLATAALGYATNQEAELRRVLLDGRLPLDIAPRQHAVRTRPADHRRRKKSLVGSTEATTTPKAPLRPSTSFYEDYRARGGSHQAALRTLAFKWIRILYRCWIDRAPYDESKYLMALRKRKTPLLRHAASVTS